MRHGEIRGWERSTVQSGHTPGWSHTMRCEVGNTPLKLWGQEHSTEIRSGTPHWTLGMYLACETPCKRFGTRPHVRGLEHSTEHFVTHWLVNIPLNTGHTPGWWDPMWFEVRNTPLWSHTWLVRHSTETPWGKKLGTHNWTLVTHLAGETPWGERSGTLHWTHGWRDTTNGRSSRW